MSNCNNTIKIRATLSAYTKIPLPKEITKVSELENDLHYVEDTDDSENLYARKNGEWVRLERTDFGDKVELDNATEYPNGLTLRRDNYKVYIATDQWIGDIDELPLVLENNRTYYTYDNNTYSVCVNGGTAFIDLEENNPYSDISDNYNKAYKGGDSRTNTFDVIFLPIDAQGE